ncbi:Drc3 [Phodopus roborovskii]|uniref:Dynein regulatory complex subunit 3 n=1 Tax=Phodopus roborovskii TaxID=109678 RepID=A0AAU9Z2E2_PHORO|nr:Drc3 [Phodopus roborovskii]
MSRPYDSMDPKVMDDDMLKAAVGEQGPQEEAGQLAKQEGILFKDVLSLQLDFQNILRIDNLWQFENLQKLQLNNNIIERIEGLENLTHLVWLDLSFNNIEAIEGLDSLVNLEDLSLSNNRISKIDSLDALVKLQVLSLGNNQISNMMNVIYLRRFTCLRTLTLSGNPIAEAEEYKVFIHAYLPDLVYLDFRRIDEQAKEMAKIKHQYSIDELKHREAQMQARLEDEKVLREKLAAHKQAFIEHLDGSYLFNSMYSEDVEGNKLSYLPGVGELLEAYPFEVTAAFFFFFFFFFLGAGLAQVPLACLEQVHFTLYLSFHIISCETLVVKSLLATCMQKAIPVRPVSFVGQWCLDFCRHTE